MRDNSVVILVRAIPIGAAMLIGTTSVLLAVAGAEAVWISSPIAWPDAWNLFVAATMFAAIRPPGAQNSMLRQMACAAVAFLLVLAIRDVMIYYLLLTGGAFRTTLAIPLSILVVGILAWGMARLWPGSRGTPAIAGLLPRLAGIATGGLLTTLALLLTFGATDYRRRADCAIVLGAGVWDDGTPSLALSDRVNEGIRLWQTGLVDRLVMTGGTGRNGWSEPEVMKRMALAAGVPEGAVLTDGEGMDTFRSADNCRVIMDREGLKTALVVSHYYHLARCRTVFALAGIQCATVPARMTRRLKKEPYYVLRECAGFIAYLLPRSS